MKKEEFFADHFMDMDPMHDCYAVEIKIENNCLTIIYDKLDDIMDYDGTSYIPWYNYKKLSIKYEFEFFCDAELHYWKNKSLYLDMMEDMEKFNKLTQNCVFWSYKYSVDSFGELNLEFSIENKRRKCKYYYLNIRLDAGKITYLWE